MPNWDQKTSIQKTGQPAIVPASHPDLFAPVVQFHQLSHQRSYIKVYYADGFAGIWVFKFLW